MTFRVPFISARRTFDTLNSSGGDAGDFIIYKNQSVSCCKKCCRTMVDPTPLNNNLIKKMDLNGLNVLQTIYPISNPTTPTTINPNRVFYLTYTIDPDGLLFGNTPCGINHYPNYMVYK